MEDSEEEDSERDTLIINCYVFQPLAAVTGWLGAAKGAPAAIDLNSQAL